MEESSKATTTLKLVISKTTNQVIFAEAKKDFVDFLFHILSFPVGSITKLFVTEDGENTDMFGSVTNLYRTLCDLKSSQDLVPNLYDKTTTSILEQTTKATLATNDALTDIPRLYFPTSTGMSKSYYGCISRKGWDACGKYMSPYAGASCPYCGREMNKEMVEVEAGDDESGYVKETNSYMVMDDLRVLPSSPVSGIFLLKDVGIRDFSSVEERVVSVGFDQGVSLLKASMHSKTVLTDVFLGGKKAIKQEPKE